VALDDIDNMMRTESEKFHHYVGQIQKIKKKDVTISKVDHHIT